MTITEQAVPTEQAAIDVRVVPLTNLFVDALYQRPLDEKRVERMADNWNERLAGLLEVSDRQNGKLAVFDGQHRLEALRKLKRASAPCLVHRGLDTSGEADLFASLQLQRKNLKPLDRFKAQLVAGSREAKAIQRIVEDEGFAIGKPGSGTTEHCIGAISTLERIYRRNPRSLSDGLYLIHELWFREPKSTDGNFVNGFCRFVDSYGHRLDDAKKAKLRELSPAVILRRAAGRQATFGGNKQEKIILAEFRRITGLKGAGRRPR